MKNYSEEFRRAMTDIEVVNISKNSLPEYSNDWDAGCDVRIDFSRVTPEDPLKTKGNCQFLFENEVNSVKSFILDPKSRAIIPTGLFVSIPKGYEIQMRPRSGLSFKVGLTLINSPGTIDSPYKNEVCLIVINEGTEPIVMTDGERIGQLVLKEVQFINWVVKRSVKEFSDQSDRGGGIGHSGVN